MTSDRKYVDPKEEQATKRNTKAPCVFTSFSSRYQKDIEVYPAVFCTFNCDSCGWNPTVAEKRLQKVRDELKAREKGKRKADGLL